MGLKLKPRKCRSLSVRAGKSVALAFSLGADEILSILGDRYHKFLRGFFTFYYLVASVASVIRDRMGDQLKNIDSLFVRNEYKVRFIPTTFFVRVALCSPFTIWASLKIQSERLDPFLFETLAGSA